MSKAHGNKLIKEFESAINEYLASFDSLINKDFSPNFEKIEKFLKQNKTILKKNTRGYAVRQLREFYQYLKNLNGDDQTIRLLDFYEGNKIIVLSGKATEAYKALIKEIESYLSHKEGIEKTVFSITTHFSLSTEIKSIASSVAKNAAKLTRNLGESLIAAASNPWLSFKAATSFALYALSGQPVAGMTTASNITKKQRDSRLPTINHLLSSNESDWHRYYDYIEIMLQEFERYASGIDEDDKSLFFKFLEEVINGNKASNLSDESKASLFSITKKELEGTAFSFNKISDVKNIYRIFFIFYRLDYKKDQRSVQTIFELLDRYATKLASHSIEFNPANEARIEYEVRNVFWILNVNFEEYAKCLVDFFGVNKFKQHFDVLQKMNWEIYRWDSDSIFSFYSSLDTIRRLHFYAFKDNQEIGAYLNDSAQVYVTEILRLAKNGCFSLTQDEIKEAAYITYVRKLPSEARQSFAGLYKEVKKSKVFPHWYQHKVSASANTAQFVIYSQQQLSSDDKSKVNQAINNTYQRIEKLKARLGVFSKEDVSKIIFRLHLFKDREAYVNYGPLWGVNTAGGGYAHVRPPSDDDELQFHSSESFESNKLWYETFIYQQEGDTRNAKNKEGGSFRNLGHEVQHTLFYALMGAQGLNNLPAWLVEGIANYLGNEDCFKEEADYIKSFQEQGRLLSVMHIINLSYANGGDLYYFGSTLVQFMLEQHSNTLKEILTEAQAGKQESEINRIIKQWAAHPAIENDFNTRTTRLINACSKRNQGEGSIAVSNVQTEYRKDLQNNPNLLGFIQRNGPIEFTFANIIFTLETGELKAAHYYKDFGKITPKKVTPDDYSWLKIALIVYVAKNKFPKNVPTEHDDKILAHYFGRSIEGIQSRLVKSINLSANTDFNQTIEDFALKTCFPAVGKRSLSRAKFYDDLSRMRVKGSLSSTCQAYLNGKNQPILDNVQTKYRNDATSELWRLLIIIIILLIIFVLGITAVLGVLYFNKKRKSVTRLDSEQPRVTHDFPDSAVSAQPEKMLLTTFPVNEINKGVPQDFVTAPFLVNKNRKANPLVARPTVPPPLPPILQGSAASQNNGAPTPFPKPKLKSKNIENDNPFSEQCLPLLPNNDSQNVDSQLLTSNNSPAFFRTKSPKTDNTLSSRNNSTIRDSLNQLPAGNTRNIAATLFNK